MSILNIAIQSYKGPAECRPKTDSAVALLNEITNSNDFREKVIGYGRYKYNEGLSSLEIYNRLMTGERRGKGNLKILRGVEFNYTILPGGKRSNIGYRNADTNDVFTYNDRFDEMDVHDLVSHLGHEVVGHLAGDFGHPQHKVRGRGRSVPYMVDQFIDELLDQLPEPG